MDSAGRGLSHHFNELEVLWTPQASLDRRVDRLNHHESLSSQAIDSSGRRACIGYQPADARYAVPRTIIAHTVRAILLASATAMTIGRFCRAFMPSIHGNAFTALDRVSAVRAPVTSNRRKWVSRTVRRAWIRLLSGCQSR